MTQETFRQIRVFLDEQGIAYEHLQHGHVHTSQDAAKVRGTDIRQAAKALILKERTSGKLYQFIVAGDRRLDLNKIKKTILQAKNISLAAPEDVLAATGCTVGSVPPFGNLFGLPTYFDEHLQETQDYIVFSAGTHNDSIKMRTADFLAVTKPLIANYSKEA